MIRFIIETPLTDDKVCTAILDLLNHIVKRLPLILAKLFVFVDASDVELVLGLGSWWLKRTGQDSKLGISDCPRHARMRHILVDEDTLDQ